MKKNAARWRRRGLWAAAALLLWPEAGLAQELTPRAYWPAPRGTKVAVLGYSYANGDVLFDPSVPLYGVDSSIHAAVVAYLQTFSLAGRSANLLVELPYSWGTTKGLLFDTSARRAYSGTADLGLTLAVNLIGAPTLTVEEFQALRAKPHPILGASLKLLAPIGRYESDRLINVGANRWAVKAELGYMIPLRPKWLLELEGGAWFFDDDDDFLAGPREQEPIFAFELHLVHRFRPGFWAAFDANYFFGGRQTIGGNELADIQRNSRLGATVVMPFHRRHAIKVGYSRGVVTEFGTDFQQLLTSYQVVFR